MEEVSEREEKSICKSDPGHERINNGPNDHNKTDQITSLLMPDPRDPFFYILTQKKVERVKRPFWG